MMERQHTQLFYISEQNSWKADLTNDCPASVKCMFILFIPRRVKGGYSEQEGIKMIILLRTRQIASKQILQAEGYEGCTHSVSGLFAWRLRPRTERRKCFTTQSFLLVFVCVIRGFHHAALPKPGRTLIQSTSTRSNKHIRSFVTRCAPKYSLGFVSYIRVT